MRAGDIIHRTYNAGKAPVYSLHLYSPSFRYKFIHTIYSCTCPSIQFSLLSLSLSFILDTMVAEFLNFKIIYIYIYIYVELFITSFFFPCLKSAQQVFAHRFLILFHLFFFDSVCSCYNDVTNTKVDVLCDHHIHDAPESHHHHSQVAEKQDPSV